MNPRKSIQIYIEATKMAVSADSEKHIMKEDCQDEIRPTGHTGSGPNQ